MKVLPKYIKWLTLLLSLSWVNPLCASELEAGIKAVTSGDYQKAFQVFNPLANKGNDQAQYNLAMLYMSGKGVAKDLKKAAYWFEKAAQQGLVEAQFNLGHMYDMGQGVNHNAGKAVLWYKKAAEHGHPLAQTNLGVMYANGEGVKQDIVQAYVWLLLAAAQGVAIATSNEKILSKELSPKMKQNIRKVSREYFKRYVIPFQVTPSPKPHSASSLHKHPPMP